MLAPQMASYLITHGFDVTDPCRFRDGCHMLTVTDVDRHGFYQGPKEGQTKIKQLTPTPGQQHPNHLTK